MRFGKTMMILAVAAVVLASANTWAYAQAAPAGIVPDKDGQIVIRLTAAGPNDAILQGIEIE